MSLNSLSGRFLILTTVFVMLAEVMIFVPSVARFRLDYLTSRLERAQIASLVLVPNEMISPELEEELLKNAGVYNVVLRRDEVRELALSRPFEATGITTYDLRDPSATTLIRDAMTQLFAPEDQLIRVIGNPVRKAGLLIEVTMPSAPLRDAMIEYGLRILLLSAVISIFTALLLFVAVRRFLVKPIRGVVEAMKSYADEPEDARRIIVPSAGLRELHDAEQALQSMQTQLTSALKQKERLAQLGSAVAKVSHDLRNILTTSQLFADRLEAAGDPAVRRMTPKLVASIARAVNLCEATLAFGRAEEPPPALNRVALAGIVHDVLEGERLAAGDHPIEFVETVPPGMTLRADAEQLHRVLSNLVRNARQAIVATGRPGEVRIEAAEDEAQWSITVADTGPGMPPKAREHLFTAFAGGARKGGAGLGLAIAAELVRGHGGRLELLRTSGAGTAFAIRLPKSLATLQAAAE